MNILSIDELRALPQAGDFDAGLYFLWLNGELQYVGKSTQIAYRIYRHSGVNRYSAVRNKIEKKVTFDRYTCLVVDTSFETSDKQRGELLKLEAAYIAAYRPLFNVSDGGWK